MNCLTSLFCCGCDDETGEDKTNKTAIINNKNNNNELNSKNNQLIPSIINNTININNETKQKLYQECQELIKQKEILQQEIKELDELEEKHVKKVLEEKDIKEVRQKNIKIMEKRIEEVRKEWSSEKEKKDKKITELMMENFTITQKMNELKSEYTKLLKQFNEIKELWEYRKLQCEQYEKELKELKKKIPENTNIKNQQSKKNLPHITAKKIFGKNN